MKTSYIFSTVLALALTASLQAAPKISAPEISEAALKKHATPTQLKRLKAHAASKARAQKERNDLAIKAKEVTASNDAGMKTTILRRTLNNMMPDCEREPETPRMPRNYDVH